MTQGVIAPIPGAGALGDLSQIGFLTEFWFV